MSGFVDAAAEIAKVESAAEEEALPSRCGRAAHLARRSVGGIDDDPQGDNPNRTNYVEKALDQVLAGQPVAQAETRSYGCSVKYK